MDDDREFSHRTFKFNIVKRAVRPSPRDQHHINFNFFFIFKIYKWIRNLDFPQSRQFMGEDYPYGTDTSARATSFSHEEIQKAVERVLTPLPLVDDERRQLIELACKEARETHLPGWKVTVDIDLELHVVNHYILRMGPAADSSLRLLKKYEIDYSGNDINRESCCCICLEDYADVEGREALVTPCEHVFHGHCIRKWLKTSHYCPLCRFKMSTS